MIPALVTSAVNRYDLLQSMLDSLDVEVERGLVCINGRESFSGRLPASGDWRVVELGWSSLGWPGTLNFGITRTPDADWWLLTNNDLYYESGALERLASRMAEHGREPVVITHRWAAVALNAAVVERVGLFDEWAFWPLYFDDTDYAYRCHLAGIPVLADLAGVIEGDGDVPNGLTTATDETLAHANNRTWIVNQAAYVAKWGGRPGREKFTTPYDSGLPLWSVRPSLAGRVERLWPV